LEDSQTDSIANILNTSENRPSGQKEEIKRETPTLRDVQQNENEATPERTTDPEITVSHNDTRENSPNHK
jgi:hypothetical protein